MPQEEGHRVNLVEYEQVVLFRISKATHPCPAAGVVLVVRRRFLTPTPQDFADLAALKPHELFLAML